MSRPRKRLLTFNDPQPLRIDRRLAMEIGFIESVVLLQIEFLISISHNERDGQFWTYHTLKDLKDRHFPWLSQATICRTLQSLERVGLIVRGHFNRSGFDRTQWFALNYDGIAKLRSVRIGEDAPILHSGTRTLQDETPILQCGTSLLRAEATIPERTTETHREDHNNGATRSSQAPRTPKAGEDGVVASAVESLIGHGVSRRRAESLAKLISPESIVRQVEFIRYRKADDPAAVLVKAIEEDWAPPADYVKAQTERRREERKEARREQKAREEAAQHASTQAQIAAQDSWWDSLEVHDQDGLREQAEAALRQKSPFLFSNGGPKKTGVMYRTMFDAERRRMIAERMTGG